MRTTKSGFRVTSKSLVGYLCFTDRSVTPRCGLIINKSVGGSVVRHSVARKIRHILHSYLDQLPVGALLVVRVLPGSQAANFKAELSQIIRKLLTKSLAV